MAFAKKTCMNQLLQGLHNTHVKNVPGTFSCLFDGSLVWFENETKSDENPISFLVNAMEIA